MKNNGDNNNSTTANKIAPKSIKFVDKRSWAQKYINPDEIGNESAPFDEKTLYPTYVSELEDKIKKSEQQLLEYIAAYKESKKEQEGFRQRMEKLKDHDIAEYKINIFIKFIEIIDDLERAFAVSRKFDDVRKLLDGIQLVRNRMLKLLQSEEVDSIILEDRIFDPKFCEPVSIELTENKDKDDTIAEVVLPGYKYKDRIIRPAKVIVFKAKQ